LGARFGAERLDETLDEEQRLARDVWLTRTPLLFALATRMANEAFRTSISRHHAH
jgi:hypothetical protein